MFASLSGQLGTCFLSLAPSTGLLMQPAMPGFYVGSGSLNVALMFVQQALYPWNHLPSVVPSPLPHRVS